MEQRIDPKVGVVIVAAGSGARFGGELPKQYRILGHSPILAHTINQFARTLPLAEIVVIVSPDRVEYCRNLMARFEVAKHQIVEGGAERFDSVKRGIEALSDQVEIIAVHDGVRPLCSGELIKRCIEGALSNGSAIPAIEISDSLRRICSEGGESQSVDRGVFRAVQTPQCFDATLLRRAYRQQYNPLFTDDASLVEAMGEQVWLCEGERENIKITNQEDLLLAELYLKKREEQNNE